MDRSAENRIVEKNPKKNRIIVAVVILILLGAFLWYEDKHLVVTRYDYQSAKVTSDMDGYKILQISDLHNASFGINNKRLLAKVKNENPDIIVITGDIVDSSHTNINTAVRLAGEMTKLCPVYYVTGNHEYWLDSEKKETLITGLTDAGVVVLSNEAVTIFSGDDSFALIGIDDKSLRDDTLKSIVDKNDDNLKVVLAHEPQYVNNYANSGADLVISGHAHGGQVRLPKIGGIYAPDQGLFPKYTEGIHVENETTMVVSRGLGNSVILFRIFNEPEIVVISLRSD